MNGRDERRPRRARRLSRPAVPGAESEPVPLGDAVELVGRELGLPDARAFGRLVSHWVDVVGETVAAHAAPRTIRDGVLVVVADSPAWASQLRYLASEIVRGASRFVGPGVVSEVRAVVER